MASASEERLLTAEEFLAIEWGSSDIKAELDDGAIRMMAGGSEAHARVAGNTQFALRTRLRGSGCRTCNSDFAIRTHGGSIRYPDASVFCGRDFDAEQQARAFDDPTVIVEVLSPSTQRHDRGVKLDEYRALPSAQTIVLIDPLRQRLRVLQRKSSAGWTDDEYAEPVDLDVPSLGLTIPHAEIFAVD
ncbi:Uma2 family endonuclease [uncultured Sphingomonas sp.]|uniref:Uma2 family endonuclease n=1 Tax=uncultured Sphingomonas sp. TaxID=158754 RepID=UPI0035CA8180